MGPRGLLAAGENSGFNVSLARRIFGDLEGRRALLIGSGKMMHLVAKHLISKGVSDVTVISRTYNRAVRLADLCGGRPVHWEDGLDRLGEMDIVVSCTPRLPVTTSSAIT